MATFDFIHLPGGGGQTGTAVTALEVTLEVVSCVGNANLFACFEAVLTVFLEVFEVFLGLAFKGRPKVGKDSATDDLALFFIPSSNPVVALWGIGIRALEGQGIPISTSNPRLTAKYVRLAQAAHTDLERQFGKENGATYFTQYAYLGSFKNPDSNGVALRARRTVDQHYTDAVHQGHIDPKTGFPYPGKQPPPPPPPPSGPCKDPCEEQMFALVQREVLPILSNAADALWWLRSALGPSTSRQNPSAIDRIATALTDLEACLCADLNAMAGPQFTINQVKVERIAVALEKLAGEGRAGAGGFDPDVSRELKRIADELVTAPAHSLTLRPAHPDAEKLKAQALAVKRFVLEDAPIPPGLRQVLLS